MLRVPICLLGALLLCSCEKSDPVQETSNTESTEPSQTDTNSPDVAEKADPQPESESELQPDSSPGPKVGDQAAAFELEDQNGQTRSLASLLQQGKVALVFYRSADW